ncbi:MAG: hypothetical protein K9M10_04105 [Candidatus Pacebacteria bacterium]|nr:hypothetical protein [Candidatus Paceibacterota bacterium]MCF7857629.1 hypothetical protein [Candidatus Paceibacterota bacterium]
MQTKIFTDDEIEKYLFEIVFHGPSFEGVMEIDALAKEIQGLEDILKAGVHSLKKSKRINIGNDDIIIYVAAFEKSSFKKRILIFNKKTGEYQHLIALSALMITLFQFVSSKEPDDIRQLTPAQIVEIRDEVAVELLQSPAFLKATAAIVQSVSTEGDMCKFTAPDKKEITITPEISRKMQELAVPAEEVEDGEFYEIIPGRISKVDLDASKRHIGFKYNGEGDTIDATFEEKPDSEVLKSLLGAWVEVRGNVSYVGANRKHITIKEYSVMTQGQITFSSPEEQ